MESETMVSISFFSPSASLWSTSAHVSHTQTDLYRKFSDVRMCMILRSLTFLYFSPMFLCLRLYNIYIYTYKSLLLFEVLIGLDR